MEYEALLEKEEEEEELEEEERKSGLISQLLGRLRQADQ